MRARLHDGADAGSVYWCPACGGYHISSSTRIENDALRAAYLVGNTFEGTLDNPDPNSRETGGPDVKKLVRDHIDRVPWRETDPAEVAKLREKHLGWVAPDSARYHELLRIKAIEECGELLDAYRAGDRDGVLEEAADVYETLRAVLVAVGIASPATASAALEAAAERKFAERGGFFTGRTWSGPDPRAGGPN